MYDAEMSSQPVIPLSQGRVRLFQLVDSVLSGKTPRVVLSHRDRGDNVVLIAAAELEQLERDLGALRAQMGVGPLRGLGALHAPLEQTIDAIRARQKALEAKKSADLGESVRESQPKRPARAAEPGQRGYQTRRPRA